MHKWENITEAQKEMYAAFDFFRRMGFDADSIMFGCDDSSIGVILVQGGSKYPYKCGVVGNPEKELAMMRDISIEINDGTVPDEKLSEWMIGSKIMQIDTDIIAHGLTAAGFVLPNIPGEN